MGAAGDARHKSDPGCEPREGSSTTHLFLFPLIRIIGKVADVIGANQWPVLIKSRLKEGVESRMCYSFKSEESSCKSGARE